MKMTQQHYDHLRGAVALIWTQEKHDAQRQFIVNEGKSKDIEKRLRWDWLWYAKVSPWVCENLYSYLDDTHINTAMKQVIKDLQSA